MGNFVTIQSQENETKLKNLFNVWVFIGFCWIIFHFTIIFFFWIILKSILLIGVFLGLGNLIALFLDIPIGVMQKYIRPKTFIVIAAVLMLVVCGFFIKFAYMYDVGLETNSDGILENAATYLGNFLNSGVNILMLLGSACLYGVIKESFDVTVLSYIFNNSSPSEYAKILSKYNIFNGWGSMAGLIFSGILLALSIKIAIPIFMIILWTFLWFIWKYFDNWDNTLQVGDVKKIKLDVVKNNLLSKKDDIVAQLNTKNFIELSKKTKLILLKPIEIKKSLDMKDIISTSAANFSTFFKLIFSAPRNILIFWFLMLIMQYGFWDTFVATFLVQFLEKVLISSSSDIITRNISGYILLWLLVIPAFSCQQFFINLSKKFWVFIIVMIGNIISAVSMVCFWLADNLYFIMLFGIMNSIWYAATMPLAQANFSGIYNETYAKKFNLKEIDSTVSAAPLKIVINTTNVLGLLLWALLVNVLWFNRFFIIFWGILMIFFIVSMTSFRKILIKFNTQNIKDQAHPPSIHQENT